MEKKREVRRICVVDGCFVMRKRFLRSAMVKRNVSRSSWSGLCFFLLLGRKENKRDVDKNMIQRLVFDLISLLRENGDPTVGI